MGNEPAVIIPIVGPVSAPSHLPGTRTPLGQEIATRVERFVRDIVIPYETDPRRDSHGPTDVLVQEMRGHARAHGVLTPHILADGSHLSHQDTAIVLRAAGLSILGPLAVNVNAPDEGNIYLLGRVATAEQRTRFLEPLVSGRVRSAFFMTEPAVDGGAGSDPSMMQTTARREGNHWVVNGRKTFITGAFRVVDALDAVAAETGKTVPQIALNWLLSRPTVSTLILGARNEEQLLSNLGAVGWKLTAEQIAKLDAASTAPLAYPYWHQRQFEERNPKPV